MVQFPIRITAPITGRTGVSHKLLAYLKRQAAIDGANRRHWEGLVALQRQTNYFHRRTTYRREDKVHDVRRVSEALNLLLCPHRRIVATTDYDDTFQARLIEFQRSFGLTVDGRIDLGASETLATMNTLGKPLWLRVRLGSIHRDGYDIDLWKPHRGTMPAEYRLVVVFSLTPLGLKPGQQLTGYARRAKIEAPSTTGQKHYNLSRGRREALLAEFDKIGAWRRTISAQGMLLKFPPAHMVRGTAPVDPFIVSVSPVQQFRAPLPPYKGPLTPMAIGALGLPYIQPLGQTYIGRYLYQIGPYRYFKWGSGFERDPRYHGMDCITFAGSVFGALSTPGFGNTMVSSRNLARHLSATPITWVEGRTTHISRGRGRGAAIRTYVARYGMRRKFLLWWGSHIKVIWDGTSYEYSRSRGGYVALSLAASLQDRTTYSVYEVTYPIRYRRV